MAALTSARWHVVAGLLSASVGLGGCSSTGQPEEGAPPDASSGKPVEAGSGSSGGSSGSSGASSGSGSSGGSSGSSGGSGSSSGGSGSSSGSGGGGLADAAVDTGAATMPDAGAAGPEQCVNRAPVASTWTLKWADEFDKDGAPDPSNWGYESGFVRNEELQWYQPNNATVSGGLLTIAAQRQQVANPNYVAGSSDWKTNRQDAQYTSTSMTTSGKHSFEYGRFEMCGQIDTRQGSWPAFWVLGNGRSWPASGEVDIMEYYANDVRANVCKPSGSNCDWSGSVAQALSVFPSSWSTQFHLWAMEWTATDVKLSLDDKLVYDFKVSSATSGTNPYTGNPFYILVNLAIGANGGDPTNTTFPMDYKVDYVRVYQ
jgi:beta-glucanase (GH16 family)